MTEEPLPIETRPRGRPRGRGKPKFDVKNYDGSVAHPNPELEAVIQALLADPQMSYVQLAKKFHHQHSWVHVKLNKPDVKARYNYLQDLSAKKSIIKAQITKEMIVDGIIRETESSIPNVRLRAWELLGKTLALFTDRLQHIGLPKRIVIRTEKGTEELAPDTTSNG